MFVKHDESIPALQCGVVGLASEDCYVVLRTPHNDKEYVMQRSVATKASPHFSAVNVLIIGLASEDCYVVLRTPHNDKEYVMQRKPFKADEGIPTQSADA